MKKGFFYRPKGSAAKFLEICKVSMMGKSLHIYLPVLQSGPCSNNFDITNENSRCINETFGRSFIFLVDVLVIGSSLEEIMMSRDIPIFIFQNMGFVILF